MAAFRTITRAVARAQQHIFVRQQARRRNPRRPRYDKPNDPRYLELGRLEKRRQARRRADKNRSHATRAVGREIRRERKEDLEILIRDTWSWVMKELGH